MPTPTRTLRPKVLISLAALVCVVAGLLIYNVHLVREDAAGWLFWDRDEALLFVHDVKSGLRVSVLGFVAEPFGEMLGHARSPSDKRCWLKVVRVTADATQVINANADCDMFFSPFEGKIYAGNLSHNVLLVWSASRFVPATPSERQRFDPKVALGKGPDFDNYEGWSERCCFGIQSRLSATLAQGPVVFESPGVPNGRVTFEVKRSGRGPETVLAVDGARTLVTGAEYQQLFGNR